VGHTRFLLQGKLDLAWLTFASTWLAPLTLTVAGALTCAGAALLWKESA